VGHVAAHELVPRPTRSRSERAAAAQDEREAAGRLECQWQRAQLPHEIRELVLDDQRLRATSCAGLRSTAEVGDRLTRWRLASKVSAEELAMVRKMR